MTINWGKQIYLFIFKNMFIDFREGEGEEETSMMIENS